jgi:prepilin-type N-terminal cleavage/methylation domain-containing protein
MTTLFALCTKDRVRRLPFSRRSGSQWGPTTQARPDGGRQGFSLIELVIVLAIMMIAASLAFINMRVAVRSSRLQSSASNYANLLQTARIRAVQDDRYYSVLMGTSTAGVPFAYVDIAGTQTFAAGDPMAVLAQGVVPQPYASGPAKTNLISQFLPAGTSGTVNAAAAGPTFGPRGLPCTPVANAGYMTCPFITPTSYVTFLQNQEGGAWEAITITPAGRVRLWAYGGTAWSPLN